MEFSDKPTGSQSPTVIRGGKLKSLVCRVSRGIKNDSVSDVNTELETNINLSINPFGASKNILSPARNRQIKTSMNGLQKVDMQGSDYSGSKGKSSMQDLPITKGDNMLMA
jgi:hypothetical protein